MSWMDECDLNIIKEKLKSTSGSNSIKESKHGTHESRRWRTCKAIMFSKEAKASARGTKAFTTQTYSLTCLKVKLWWRWWGPKWKML